MAEFWKVRTARREHDCAHLGCVIHPGEAYVDSATPPWTLIQDDPDYPAWKQGVWERTRQHRASDAHNEDGMLDLFHRTTPEAAAEIRRTKVWRSQEGGAAFFSNRPDGQATGYGDAILHIRIPRVWAELDDEFPDGEMHYRVNTVRAAHYIVSD